MDEETNLSQTIENDMKNRDKNKGGPVARKLRNKANKEVKKATKKARKKLKSMLFKPVYIGLLPALIIIFMLIGIISFITSMPGLVQEEMLQKVIGFVDGFKEIVYGSDFYLSKLASDSDQTAQKNVLKYLDEMGIDPVGFGFAPFYHKNADGEVSFETSIDIDGTLNDISGFFKAFEYNQELTEERLREDLILKYIISNERTFLIHDLDKVGNKDTDVGAIDKILGNYNLKGMIKTGIEGWDDSTIKVDRENKQMVIKSLNFKLNNLTVYNQTAKYNLESWTGRYGMPLEFLLAIHIATMSSDLTEEMLENKNLQTVVDVKMEKDTYEVEYEFEYDSTDDGIDNPTALPFRAKSGGTNDDLCGILDYTEVDDNNIVNINLTDEEIVEKYKSKITINSLQGLVDNMIDIKWNNNKDMITYEGLNETAIEKFIGNEAYRVRYKLFGETIDTDIPAWLSSAYLDIVHDLDDATYKYNPRVEIETGDLGTCSITQASDDDSYIVTIEDDTVSYGRYINKIYINPNGVEPIDLTKHGYDTKFDGSELDSSNRETDVTTSGILYGLDHYINEGGIYDIINNEDTRLGITCMLSQIDAYLYWQELYNCGDNNINFSTVGIDYVGSGIQTCRLTVVDENGEEHDYDMPQRYKSRINAR